MPERREPPTEPQPAESGLEALRAPPRRRKSKDPSTATLRLLATELLPRVAETAPPITGPEDAGALLVRLIGAKDREHFVVLHLDTRHAVRGAETVAIGSLNGALVHPREVFKGAILANSHAIICGHNHPSGNLEPSADDLALHRRLRDAGHLLGIEVLDFLVVSADGHRSLREL